MQKWPYPSAVEHTDTRPPEWEDVELAPGQFPSVIEAQWDPVHDYRKTDGPTVSIKIYDPVAPY